MQGDCDYCSGQRRQPAYRDPLEDRLGLYPTDMCRSCLLMFVEDIRDALHRISDGCPICGTLERGMGYRTGELTNRTSGLILFKSRKICWDCWGSLSEDYYERFPHKIEETVYAGLITQIVQLKDKINGLKEKARGRDRKYKDRKKAEREAGQPSIVAQLVSVEDWGQLYVVFGKDTAGTRLIDLASHAGTPENEKQAALNKLINRRPRWRHRSTTSAEMRSTRPGTKSPLSLASSKGE